MPETPPDIVIKWDESRSSYICPCGHAVRYEPGPDAAEQTMRSVTIHVRDCLVCLNLVRPPEATP